MTFQRYGVPVVLMLAGFLAGCPWLRGPMRVGMVVDMPISGSVFNATAWQGLVRAQDELGVEPELWENAVFDDYGPGIRYFVDGRFDMIITVGFPGVEATRAAAQLYSDIPFVCVDVPGQGDIPNLAGAVFDSGQGTYLAGYLAAGMSKTGKVGVMGGMNIPPVVAFFDGYAAGVAYYNEQKGTAVEVLGMDTFIGSFDDVAAHRAAAEAQLVAGADVIMPVSGDGGKGALEAVASAGNALFIGVDVDQYLVQLDYGSVMLTSVMKHLDAAVFEMVQRVQNGSFNNTDYVGTLANGGVGLAPFHDCDARVPDALKQELAALRPGGK